LTIVTGCAFSLLGFKTSFEPTLKSSCKDSIVRAASETDPNSESDNSSLWDEEQSEWQDQITFDENAWVHILLLLSQIRAETRLKWFRFLFASSLQCSFQAAVHFLMGT
jgi:hypothetical protein